MPCRNRCASHQASFLSVLCPRRFLTSWGFAKVTRIARTAISCCRCRSCWLSSLGTPTRSNLFTSSLSSLSTLNTGSQYTPVLSKTTSWQPRSTSHCFICNSCPTVVPNFCVSQCASWFAAPHIQQTITVSRCTSTPAHLSKTTAIIRSPSGAKKGIASLRYVAQRAQRRLNSGCNHATQAKLGSDYSQFVQRLTSSRAPTFCSRTFSSLGVSATPPLDGAH